MPRRTDLSGKTFIRMRGAPMPDTSIPFDAASAPPLRAPTQMRRARTLTRPERSQPQTPLISPPSQLPVGGTAHIKWWPLYARCVTFWAPGSVLASLAGLRDKPSQQAWREKCALCSISLLLGGFVVFITICLTIVFCPASAQNNQATFYHINDRQYSGELGIDGWMFKIGNAEVPDASRVGFDLYNLSRAMPGSDMSFLFRREAPACTGLNFAAATLDTCSVNIVTTDQKPGCVSGDLTASNLNDKKFENSSRQVGYGWLDMSWRNLTNFIVCIVDECLPLRYPIC